MSPGHWGLVSERGLARLRVAPGTYTVANVYVPGYSFNPAKAPPTVVEAGKVQRAIVTVSSALPVEGLVHDAGGGPVSGARVRILTFGGLDRRELVTDEEGEFSVHMVLVAGPAAEVGFMVLARHAPRGLAALKGVEKGGKRARIMLEEALTLSGLVVDKQGRPIEKARVRAKIVAPHIATLWSSRAFPTDDKGRYRIGLIPPGMGYTVSAQARGYGPADVRVNTQPGQRGNVKVKDLVLEPANRSVSGLVRDQRGNPVHGAIVVEMSVRQPLPRRSSVTDEKGRFTLEHLVDRELYLHASVPGWGWEGKRTAKPDMADVVITVGPRRSRALPSGFAGATP